MFHRRPEWVQLVRYGTPELFVLRPLAGGFTPPDIGDPYPPPEPSDKNQMQRARQMYQQRRIGTKQELDLFLARRIGPQKEASAAEPAARPKKEKAHGRS